MRHLHVYYTFVDKKKNKVLRPQILTSPFILRAQYPLLSTSSRARKRERKKVDRGSGRWSRISGRSPAICLISRAIDSWLHFSLGIDDFFALLGWVFLSRIKLFYCEFKVDIAAVTLRLLIYIFVSDF